MNKNKNIWKYYFVTEFIGGGYIDHIVIVTDAGKKFAEEYYIKTIDEYCEDRNKEWFSFHFTGKTKESVG